MLETESVQSETARNFSRLFNESGYTSFQVHWIRCTGLRNVRHDTLTAPGFSAGASARTTELEWEGRRLELPAAM
jgi:hypothetical protein